MYVDRLWGQNRQFLAYTYNQLDVQAEFSEIAQSCLLADCLPGWLGGCLSHWAKKKSYLNWSRGFGLLRQLRKSPKRRYRERETSCRYQSIYRSIEQTNNPSAKLDPSPSPNLKPRWRDNCQIIVKDRPTTYYFDGDTYLPTYQHTYIERSLF